MMAWYEVVQIYLVPRSSINCCQRLDSNCHSWSVDSLDGMPECAFQPFTNVQTGVLAVISAVGNVSGQSVNCFTLVSTGEQVGVTSRRWQRSHDVEMDAIKTNIMWYSVEVGVTVCCCTFDHWHCVHDCAHLLTSILMFGEMNRALTKHCVTWILG